MTGARVAQTSAEKPWAILILLTIGWTISFIDRTSLSSAMADKHFIHEFGLTSVDRGWLGSAIFWSYAVLQLPMGWVVDRFGVKWPYAICFALWCVAAAATSLSHSLPSLFVVRLLIGASEAVVLPASYRYIANRFDEAHKGTATGIFSLGGKVGPAIGAAIAAWLIVTYSWKDMFVLTGLLGMVWLVPWLLMVKNDFPTREQLAAAKRRAKSVPLRNLLVSPVVWGGFIMTFCYTYFVFYCATWMPSYLVEQRGLSLMKSGMLTFVSFISVAIVAVTAGWAADRIIARGRDALVVRKAFVVAGALGGMTVLLGAYAQSQEAALFWNVASLSLAGLATANNLALSKLTLIPKQAIGLSTGILTIATSLAGGVSASLCGWLLHVGKSYTLPMLSVCIFLGIGAVSAIVLMRREWAPKVNEVVD
ncbi:MFS transporter [Paraburkholderia acidisoli]|uniref:MFS transporter n=1 Tax=Paraburkholderia acidisoli TaxID=2571748 RepID=A0A7Z2GQI4_9BURK|nr:MFS transporter [Paraburkholderia acidisoli]QGZ66137.1 MFS transporter [Paraburkholderia acidisoli]